MSGGRPAYFHALKEAWNDCEAAPFHGRVQKAGGVGRAALERTASAGGALVMRVRYDVPAPGTVVRQKSSGTLM